MKDGKSAEKPARRESTIDLKIIMLEKRIEDLRWFLSIVSGFATVIIAVLALIFGLNFSAEKATLQEFRGEIKTEVNDFISKSGRPVLELKTITGKNGNGMIIDAWMVTENDKHRKVCFDYVIHNKGNGVSGPMFYKIYSNDIPFPEPDIDNTGYKYSTFADSDKFTPKQVFGNASMIYTSSIGVPSDFTETPKQAAVMIRIYYGNGEMTESNIVLQFKK
uniref:Uncharacterized protein n=1 Tax=Desulfovibrio sp. U5L TaxID=596152 RepID=I2PZ29_9BACT